MNDGMTDKQEGRKNEGDRNDRTRKRRKSEKESTKLTSHALLMSRSNRSLKAEVA
jgi:hypothetical protein